MIRAQTLIRQHRVETPVDLSNFPETVTGLVGPSAHKKASHSNIAQSNTGTEPSPARTIHPDPVAGRYMFADGAPRLDEIERLAVERSKQIDWDGKRRSVEHWRGWLISQYEKQHAKWFSKPTRKELVALIELLQAELDRLPYAIGGCESLSYRTSDLRAKIAAAEAELATLSNQSSQFQIAAE